MEDKEGYNILQLAAKLPSSRLKDVLGAALQLRHEWDFFEKVKKMFGAHHMEYVSLFEEEHEELRRKGGKWLTNCPCMSVTKILTVEKTSESKAQSTKNSANSSTPPNEGQLHNSSGFKEHVVLPHVNENEVQSSESPQLMNTTIEDLSVLSNNATQTASHNNKGVSSLIHSSLRSRTKHCKARRMKTSKHCEARRGRTPKEEP